jgi:hypothetical protein
VFLACYERLSKSYDQDVRAEFDKTKQPQMRVAEYVSNVVQMELFYIYIYIYIYMLDRLIVALQPLGGWQVTLGYDEMLALKPL